MTLQASGQISMSDLRSEYTNLGPRAEVRMSQFYYGSTYLRSNACSDLVRGDASHPRHAAHFPNIPALNAQGNPSTSIRLTNFYGRSYFYARQATVTVSGNNASVNSTDIENEAIKSNDINTVFYVVATNGNCAATSTANYGLVISQGSRGGTTCYLINDHRIYGRGGRGGDGGGESGNPGAGGGPALFLAPNVYLRNNNRILGGGNGGAGSAARRNSYNECYCCNITNASIAGSGGGGGKGGGAGGSAGTALAANFRYSGGAGGEGNYDDTGDGGAGGGSCSYNTVIGNYCSTPGETGGGWGGGTGINRRASAYYVVLASGTVSGGTGTF